MSRWIVDWETWNFDEAGEIEDVTWLTPFTIEANSLEEAIKVAEKKAPEELRKVRERMPSTFMGTSNSVPYILGLKDEEHVYHKLANAHEVFGTLRQIREKDDYGSSQ